MLASTYYMIQDYRKVTCSFGSEGFGVITGYPLPRVAPFYTFSTLFVYMYNTVIISFITIQYRGMGELAHFISFK